MAAGKPRPPLSEAHRKKLAESLKRHWAGKEDRTAHPATVEAARRPKTEAHKRAIGAAQRGRLAGEREDPSPLWVARQAAGKTQSAVATAMGISKQTYSDYERGRRNPTLDWLLRAAAAIGCDPASLAPDLASRRPA